MKKMSLFAIASMMAAAMFAAPVDENVSTEVQDAVPAEAMAAETVAETTEPVAEAPEAVPASAALKKLAKAFDPSVKFGGYIIGQFTATDQHGVDTHSNFNLRLIRLYLNGYAFQDFYYRLQMEVNGQPGVDKGPRVIDAFIEWQKFDEFRVKLGEFKRSFGFENPMAPLTVGHGAYSQATTKFLFNDAAVPTPRAAATSVCRHRVTSSPLRTATNGCTIRWASSTAKASTTPTRTITKTSSAVLGCRPSRTSA